MAKQIQKILEAYKGASAKGKSCVTKVMKQGKDMSAAIAICRASLGEAFDGKPAAALTEQQVEAVVLSLQNKLQEAQSFDQRAQMVRDAFRNKFPVGSGMASNDMPSIWPRDVFETYIIVETARGLVAYPYTIENDLVVFGEPYRVEVEYRKLEAGARHSREDSTALQEIHDMAVKLGATCPDMLERLQQHG